MSLDSSSDWAQGFLAKPDYVNWLTNEVKIWPPTIQGERLEDYVSRRWPSAGIPIASGSNQTLGFQQAGYDYSFSYPSTSQSNLSVDNSIDPSLLASNSSMASNFSISPQEISQQQIAQATRRQSLMSTGSTSTISINGLGVLPPIPTTQQQSTSRLPPNKVNTEEEEEAWSRVADTLERILVPARFSKSPTATARELSNLISTFDTTKSKWGDGSNVPPEGRKIVLDAIVLMARASFKKNWLEKDNERGMETLAKWLVGCAKTAAEGSLASKLSITRIPILKVFDALPLTLERIAKLDKIGKAIKKLHQMDGEKCQSLATGLVNKWSEMQANSRSTIETENKRKASPPATTATKKKAKVEPVVVKPAINLTAPFAAVSSVKLPSFKKKPVAPAPAGDVFSRMMSAMTSQPVPTPTAPTPVVAPPRQLIPAQVKSVKKKGKSVRFNDENLEQIRYIERAVYDGDEKDEAGEPITHSFEEAKEMEEQEGMTLTHMANYMEEEVEWSEPIDISFPNNADFIHCQNLGVDSTEIHIQTAREANIPAVLDPEGNIQSASEPLYQMPSGPLTVEMVLPSTMATQEILDQINHAQSVTMDQNLPMQDYSHLLNRLDSSVLNGYRSQDNLYAPRPSQSNQWDQPSNGNSNGNYDQSSEFRNPRKNLKAGRGSRRIKPSDKKCTFFLSRTGCAWGDQCSFVH